MATATELTAESKRQFERLPNHERATLVDLIEKLNTLSQAAKSSFWAEMAAADARVTNR